MSYSKSCALVIAYFLMASISSFGQVNFSQSTLNLNGLTTISGATAMEFGPDGRLYVSDYSGTSASSGTIKVLTVQRNGPTAYVVTGVEVLTGAASIPNHNDDGTLAPTLNGRREVTGLTVGGTATNPVVYVSSSDIRIGAGSGGGNGDVGLDTNSGVITRITWNGAAWQVVDLVRGLPRSEENHATNGMDLVTINGTNYLIVAQGGHTNGGSPSGNFVLTTEYALSAAVLSVDLTQLEQMPILNDNGRSYVYDLPTLDDPTRTNANGIDDPDSPGYNGIDINDPWGGNDGLNQAKVVPGGPVQIFSPGYRNSYDLVITENGSLYVMDNGPNGGWGGFPMGEGTANVTNDYDPLEPGSSSPSGGEQINNKDHLELVTTDIQNYVPGSFYGGHPNPVRANPTGAGLYTDNSSALGTTGPAIWRTQIYDPDGSTPGSTIDPNAGLPVDWPPVPIPSANPVEGDWRDPENPNPDGPDDNPITVWGTNTNGLTEYRASNFGNAMKGNLLATHSGGNIRRVQLKADGTLQQLTPSFLSTGGGFLLGITANGDGEVFPGTVWVGSLSGPITVFEPQDFVICIQPDEPGYDAQADYDGDGYTNQDEVDNGTDPCNGGSSPNDFDKVLGAPLVSDLNDPDDDGDGIPDALDPFQLGNPLEEGSDAFPLPITNDLFNDQQGLGGIFGLGITGIMNNGDTGANWLDWIDRKDDPNDPNPNDVLGGAPGIMTSHMTSGTALGISNTQEKGYQYGVQVEAATGPFTVIGGMNGFTGPNRLYGNTDAVGGELGFFIGDGTQSNYIKFVVSVDGFTVLQEINDVPQTPINTPLAVLNRPSGGILFYFIVDPSTGTVDLQYSIDGGARMYAGSVTAQGEVFNALQQAGKDLAVGFIGTSGTIGVELEGSWDFLNVIPATNSFAVRINAGGPEINQQGKVFLADQYFSGGNPYTNNSAQVSSLYKTERSSGSKTFSYTIPLKNGDYEAILHFAEIYWGATGGGAGGVGKRIFDVSMEGDLILDNFDIFAEVGAETVVVKTFPVTVSDGQLNIDFSSLETAGGIDWPKVSAIEILEKIDYGTPITVSSIANQINSIGEQLDGSLSVDASGGDGNLVYSAVNLPPGLFIEPTNGQIGGTVDQRASVSIPYNVTITVDDSDGSSTDTVEISFTWNIENEATFALRLNVGGPALEHEGQAYFADQNFFGGRSYTNANAQVAELYKTERSSTSKTFTYSIPLENGDYAVALHFAEIYWGATGGGSGGTGKRIFDVSMEGDLILDDYDIFAEVGAETVVVKSFPVTVTDGQLNIVFSSLESVGGIDQPKVSAIEIMAQTNIGVPIVVSPIANQTSVIGEQLNGSLSVLASGGDGNLSYSAVNLPPGLFIEPTNGQIGGTIQTGANLNSPYMVTITVDDSDDTVNNSITTNFLWMVTAPVTPTDGFALRLNVGGPAMEHNGSSFSGDQYFDGGRSFTNGGAEVPDLYLTERSSPSQVFGYDIPLEDGDYEVVLHFAEIYWGATGGGTGGVGKRIFDVTMEGIGILDDYDIFAEVGAQTVATKVYPVTVTDGELNLSFSSLASAGGVDQPKLSALEVLGSSVAENQAPVAVASATPLTGTGPLEVSFTGSGSTDDVSVTGHTWDFGDGSAVVSAADVSHTYTAAGSYTAVLTVRDADGLEDTESVLVTVTAPDPPVGDFVLRLNVGGSALEHNGTAFGADQYFDGGRSFTNGGAEVPDLYLTERSSPSQVFGYDIPLEDGDYEVVLHFAEIYWGATGGSTGGVGKRIFDVTMEGIGILDDYDIFAEVGAQTVATKKYPVTVTDGELNLFFSSLSTVGGVDQPKLSALEVLGVSGNTLTNKGIVDFKSDLQHPFLMLESIGTRYRSELVEPSLFPNPANYEVQIFIGNLKINITTIQVFEMDGKLVKTIDSKTTANGVNQHLFSVDDLEAGVYSIILKTDNGKTFNKQLLIRK